jgi:shikimate kinase
MQKPIPNILKMNKSNFIFLIGFMGSGKTTIGKKVAKELGYQFIDTDKLITQKEGRSISEIFFQNGEKHFRLLEKHCLNDLVQLVGNYVISTGGGMACNQDQLNEMLKNGKVVYLEIDAKSAMKRISQAKEKRPLLEGLTSTQSEIKITKLLNKRTKYYEQAHYTVLSLEAKKFDFKELLK